MGEKLILESFGHLEKKKGGKFVKKRYVSETEVPKGEEGQL